MLHEKAVFSRENRFAKDVASFRLGFECIPPEGSRLPLENRSGTAQAVRFENRSGTAQAVRFENRSGTPQAVRFENRSGMAQAIR